MGLFYSRENYEDPITEIVKEQELKYNKKDNNIPQWAIHEYNLQHSKLKLADAIQMKSN